ncbi:hypothetical protein [Glaciecola sp. SC05]|uniref:hypothetical protein n=1 Tax=Glaciecola sp. SC05 TaxID=1987355 RepID=UPI00352858A5
MNPLLIIAIVVIFLLILVLVPSKQTRHLNSIFKKPIQKLSPALEGQYARVQGKVIAFRTHHSPIFKQAAIIHETTFFTLNSREQRDPDWHSKEHNWKLEQSEKIKNDFLVENNGWYALIRTDSSFEFLSRNINDINQYDIGVISSLNQGDIKFEKIESNLKEFMSMFYSKLAIKVLFDTHILRAKETYLLDGEFVSVVGICKLEAVDKHPSIKKHLHPDTKKILVIGSCKEPLYITDNMKILFG